ncbi:MAG: TIM-barrel domain-containing protein [Bacilli bacterium]
MLDDHLQIKLDPTVNPQSIVFFKDYRITILDDCLFRVEKNKEKIYRDALTQSVWYRHFPSPQYRVLKKNNRIEIITETCSLICLDSGAIKVRYQGELITVDDRGNYLGTRRTLDRCDGNVCYDNPWILDKNFASFALDKGIISKKGVSYFDDVDALSLSADGKVMPQKGLGFDKYVFVYGKDYLKALRLFTKITGKIPLIPRFVFGNWWSRYHIYTDREYLTILEHFQERHIPLTVATIDIDWHYTNTLDEDFGITKSGRNTPFYGGNDGWTGYSWNKKLFPDYRAFLAKVHNRNLAITLNLHPAEGIRWFEDCYEEFALAMGKDPKTGEQIKFDFTSTDFINHYFRIIHQPYEKDGIDFYWIDWQQGEKTNIEGLDPLWALNHYHFLDNALNNQRPLILSRYCGVGSHRYPIGFSGDTFVSWKTLKYLPYFTATASNIGYTYWSHDIGGHMFGIKDDQLFVRFVQFGVFSPINRLHNTNFETMSKEPWTYKNGTGFIVEEFLRLRHHLIPYLYSYSYLTHQLSWPLIQPLYYHHQNQGLNQFKNQYYFGDQMLVLPITSKQTQYFAKVRMFIPKGTWTDFFTNRIYTMNEDCVVTLYRTLEEIPVLVKSGGIIPMSNSNTNGADNPEHLLVRIYNGDNHYVLYEDEGEKQFQTVFDLKTSKNQVKLLLSFTGELDAYLKERKITILFKNIKEGEISLFVNGQKEEYITEYKDCLALSFAVNPHHQYEVVTTFKATDELARAKEHFLRILSIVEVENIPKKELYDRLLKVQSIDEAHEIISIAKLPKIVKEALLEAL